MLKSFHLKDLILISLLATLSIVSKPYVFMASSFATSSLHMPAGVVGGIWYMMWISLTYRLVSKRGSVFLFGFLQFFLVMAMLGTPLIKAITYLPPVLMAELIYFFLADANILFTDMLVGAVANLTGTILSFLLFYGNQSQILLVAGSIAIVSGSLSAFISQFLVARLNNVHQLVRTSSERE